MTPQTVLDVGRDALWMCLLLVLTGPWLLQTLVDYTHRLVTGIPGLIG